MAQAKRKKVEVEVIGDVDGARRAMAELAGLGRELMIVETELNAKIDLAKAEASSQASPLKDRIKELENALAHYAEVNRESLFEKRKSVDLSFGVFGFRKSTEVRPMPKVTWAMVLAKLKELGETAAIRVKETVNKEELHRWSDIKLFNADCRRVEAERFYYEIADEDITEAA